MMSRMSDRTTVFVLGHNPRLLARVPAGRGLTTVNLDELDLPPRLRGQELAEARFFLADAIDHCEAEWIGLVSARWEDKWPAWPGLAELPALASGLSDPRMVVAPAVWWWPGADAVQYAARQDRRYPGMGALLDDPGAPQISPHGRRRGLRPLVFNNTLIAHRSVVRDWVAHLRASFAYYDGRYGLDLPFEVECAWCGTVLRDAEGQRTTHPGRLYEPTRHAGYFYEALTAKYFLSRDIVVVDAHGQPRRPQTARSWANSAYWRAGGVRAVAQRLHGTCSENHRRPS